MNSRRTSSEESASSPGTEGAPSAENASEGMAGEMVFLRCARATTSER